MRPPLPTPVAPGAPQEPQQYNTFFEHVIREDSSVRIQRVRRFELIRHYMQNEMWLEEDYATGDPTRSPFWKPITFEEDAWTPTPRQNEMVAPCQNEIARLVGVGSRPYVRVDNDRPESEKAAKVGRDVLLDRLEKLNWEEKQHEGGQHLVHYGPWIPMSYWDIDFTKTVKIPVKGALKCPECDFVSAAREVPPEVMAKTPMDRAKRARVTDIPLQDPTNPLVQDHKYLTNQCLTCSETKPPMPMMGPGPDGAEVPMMDEATGTPMMEGGRTAPPALEPFTPTDDEAKTGQDFFGRSLGEEVPLGDTGIRNISPYDWYPQNEGIDVDNDRLDEWAWKHIETVEWVRAHYAESDQVEPESVTSMAKWHPIIGGSAFFFGGGASPDPNIFDHHVIVKEFHKKPWIEKGTRTKNRGRSIVMAGNVVVLDGDYMLESKTNPGQLIPRCVVAPVQWELRDRDIFGIGGAELIQPIQDIINTTKAQAMDSRHRFGSPKVLAEEGADLYYAGFAETGYDSDVYYYRPGPDGEKPFVLQGSSLDTNWFREFEMDLDAIPRVMGTMEVETGDVPKDVTAASAFMFLGEKAGERRKPRIARIRDAKRKIYTHQLQLMHEFYREPRYYHVRDSNDKWAVKSFRGMDLMGQTTVILEDEPLYDVRMFKREAIKEGIAVGYVPVQTVAQRRRAYRALDIPLEVAEEENGQVTVAEREWREFLEEGKDPAVKEIHDSHTIHADTHKIDWRSEEAENLKDQVDWNQVQLHLEGWRQEFDAIIAMGSMPPPAQPEQPLPNPINGTVDPGALEAASAKWQAQQKAYATVQAMPRALELRILAFWTQMLAQAGIGQEDPDRAGLLARLLRFDAHINAHQIKAEIEDAKIRAGGAIPAPPGAPETAAGMMPAGGGGPAGAEGIAA